mgnify:CR=1 FL=1
MRTQEISLRERCSALRGSWSAPVRPRNCASFARSPLFCASVIFETTINCPRSCASLPWNTARCRQRECRPILLFHAPLVPALHFVIASHLLVLFHCDLLPGVILFLAFVVAWVACFLSCSCSAFALGPPLWLCCLVVRLLSIFFWRSRWCSGVCMPSVVVVSQYKSLWAVGLMKRRKIQPGRRVGNRREQLPAGPKRSARKLGRTLLCGTRTVVGARSVTMIWSATPQVLCNSIPS